MNPWRFDTGRSRKGFHDTGRAESLSHNQVESGNPTALRFAGVASVLSSVSLHILSCSLTSEAKQEAAHRADIGLCRFREGVRMVPGQDTSTREPTGSFCPRWRDYKSAEWLISYCLQDEQPCVSPQNFCSFPGLNVQHIVPNIEALLLLHTDSLLMFTSTPNRSSIISQKWWFGRE